jgi:hypothetical protein
MERHGLGPPAHLRALVSTGGLSPMAFLEGVNGSARWDTPTRRATIT